MTPTDFLAWVQCLVMAPGKISPLNSLAKARQINAALQNVDLDNPPMEWYVDPKADNTQLSLNFNDGMNVGVSQSVK